MKRWQPINTAPLDTPLVVTDGRSHRFATLQSQKPIWKFEDNQTITNYAAGISQGNTFSPTHWFLLPKLMVQQ
jgi:hypothetical protein